MKNIIFEKTVNANEGPMHMHMPHCTDADIIIMEKCGWNVWKILYDSEAIRNISAQIKTKYAENNLARLRLAAGLTQQQLADVAGVAITQIQRFESGERAIGNAAATTVAAIADALCTDVETLIADAG